MRTLREDIDVLKNKYQFRKESCLPALYLALISALCFNPRVPVEADTFNRIIGYSQYYGTDVSKRILNFSAWYMIIFPLFFILYYVLIHNILFAKSKDEN